MLLINKYVSSNVNLTLVHVSKGKPGTVVTLSHINNMISWHTSAGNFLVITNLPPNVISDAKYINNLRNIANLLSVAVDFDTLSVAHCCSYVDYDAFGQPNSCIITLPVVGPSAWQCSSQCFETQINKAFKSRVGLNVCNLRPTCTLANLICCVDGSSMSEVPFHQKKLQEVVGNVLGIEVHAILIPKHIHRPALGPGENSSHNHMVFAIFVDPGSNRSIEDLHNVLNISRAKTQCLTIDSRHFIIAKSFVDLLENPLPLSVVKSVPSVYIINNLPSTTTHEIIGKSVSKEIAGLQVYIVPNLPITPTSTVAAHIIPHSGEDLIVDVMTLPATKNTKPPFLQFINYACPSSNAQGVHVKHNIRFNHFLYAKEACIPSKSSSSVGHSAPTINLNRGNTIKFKKKT